MNNSTRGRLLLATPILDDPNFDRAVLYVLEHSAEGALAIVLNRPSETTVDEHLPALAPLLTDPPVFFSGGPVQAEALVGVTRLGAATPLVQPMAGNIGVVDLDALLDAPFELPGLRLFAGYAGWSPGQLEGELLADAWFVVDALDTDVFTAEPSDLWRSVLARQPNRLSELRLFPDDPMLN